LFLTGIGALAPDLVPPVAGLHALTVGAIGTMTLAVMTRATLGHTGRALTAGRGTLAIYACVSLGALFRVTAPIAPHLPMLSLSALLWAGAFLLFAAVYGPILCLAGLRRVPRGGPALYSRANSP
jgi:uncharacterized protein involved in response to NO